MTEPTPKSILKLARASLPGPDRPESNETLLDAVPEGTVEEFDVLYAVREWEAAWDALAEVGKREDADASFWNLLAEAARALELDEHEAMARQLAASKGD